MTDIEKKALAFFPVDMDTDYDNYGNAESVDLNEKRREGYVKCAEEYESLQKVHGWVAVNRYGCSPRAYFYPTKPKRQDGYWTEGRNVTNLAVPNWNGKFEDEPVEVELLIRRV